MKYSKMEKLMSTHEEKVTGFGERGTDQTFRRAGSVLDALTRAQESGLRFTDLIAQTGFSKATLHRLLAELVKHGFVDLEQPGARYFSGLRLGLWAAAARNRYGFAERADPIIRALSKRVQDTAYLSLRVREMAVCLVLHEGTAAVRALPLEPGDHSALGVGSAAAAILAAISDDDEIDGILASSAHIAYCAARGVTEKHIRKHIQQTRELGYAFIDDLNPNMIGIAIAVRNAAQEPVAAISVATIHSKMISLPRREAVISELQATRRQVEDILGSIQMPPRSGGQV